MEIRYKQGARINAPAKDVYAEIERIRKLGKGDLSIDRMVEESRPKDAVLHDEFEWNNKLAGHQWRLHQGRKIIQSLEIVHDDNVHTRAYESVRVVQSLGEETSVKHVFRTIEDILSDPDARDELLAQAIRDAIAFRRRYRNLQELSQVFSAFDDFLKGAEL